MSIRAIAAACVVLVFSGIANGQKTLVAPLPVSPPKVNPLQRDEAEEILAALRKMEEHHADVKGLWSDCIGTNSAYLIDGSTLSDQRQRELLALCAIIAVQKQMNGQDIARNQAKAANDKVYWMKVALAWSLALALAGLCVGFRKYRGVIRQRDNLRAENEKLSWRIYWLCECPNGAKEHEAVE